MKHFFLISSFLFFIIFSSKAQIIEVLDSTIINYLDENGNISNNFNVITFEYGEDYDISKVTKDIFSNEIHTKRVTTSIMKSSDSFVSIVSTYDVIEDVYSDSIITEIIYNDLGNTSRYSIFTSQNTDNVIKTYESLYEYNNDNLVSKHVEFNFDDISFELKKDQEQFYSYDTELRVTQRIISIHSEPKDSTRITYNYIGPDQTKTVTEEFNFETQTWELLQENYSHFYHEDEFPSPEEHNIYRYSIYAFLHTFIHTENFHGSKSIPENQKQVTKEAKSSKSGVSTL